MKSFMLAAAFIAVATQTVAAQKPATWRLVQEARIGGEAEELGEIRGVVATSSGRVFVLDYKLHEIKLFDSKGVLLRKVARDGAGPGEIRDANGLAIGPDENVWVNDPKNGRFSVFSPDGKFIRQILMPITSYGYLWGGVVDDKGRAVEPVSKYDPATKSLIGGYARMIQADGKADTIAMPMCAGAAVPAVPYLKFQNTRGMMMTSIPYIPTLQTVLTRKGTIWCTPSHEYRLSVGKIGQPLKEVVKQNVTPVAVSGDERQAAQHRVDSLTTLYGRPTAGSLSDMPKTKPVISRIFADDRGNVWVRRTDAVEAKPTFDVFDDSGKHLAVVQAPGPIGYQVFIIGSTLLTVITDDMDLPTVVKYRIQR